MSAELLIRAAQKLREAAEAATPGPWTVESAEDGHGDYMLYNVLGPTDDKGVTPIPLQTRTEDAGFHSQAEADVDYAALMHPPVALAVAKWLDLAASWYAGAPHSDEAEHALAVARAVLREPADEAVAR